MKRVQGAALLLILFLGVVGNAAGGSNVAVQEPKCEVGVLGGAGFHGKYLNPGQETGIGPLGGARLGYRILPRLGAFCDFTWATFQPREVATLGYPKQDPMQIAVGRVGVECLYWPRPGTPWTAFAAFSGGLMDVNWSNDPSTYRPSLASFGLGVRRTFRGRWALRAEVRGDRTLANANSQVEPFPAGPTDPPQGDAVGGAVTDVQALVGFSWLFGGGAKDSDEDGVTDKLDACPDTPLGWAVDARGCPLDSDGDGVPDGNDTCPDTPAMAIVDAHGCPMDSDKDGVFDGIDRCADTPSGAKVDARGCPIDTDQDGVPDGIDQCADTPAGAKVDEQGCPVAAKPAPIFQEGKKSLVLKGVTFETGKDVLTASSEDVLDQVANSLRDWPDVRLEVGGYTDAARNPASNLKLSEARATAVKIYLIGKGIAAPRLTSKGYGQANPVADNKTPEGRAQNRRVELKKID